MMDRRRALMAQMEEDLVLNDLLTLDGIRNTRNGHDASATIWQDLSGNNYDTLKVGTAGNPVWQSDHAVYDATNRGQYISHDFFSGRTAGSIEIVVQVTGKGSRTINGFQQGFILSHRSGGEDALKGFYSYSYNSGGVSSYADYASLGYSSASSDKAYICWTFDGSTAKRYLNGTLATTQTITYSNLSQNTLRIGYEHVNGYVGFPHCRIYRIGISSTAFTAEQVADRYQRFKRRFNLP